MQIFLEKTGFLYFKRSKGFFLTKRFFQFSKENIFLKKNKECAAFDANSLVTLITNSSIGIFLDFLDLFFVEKILYKNYDTFVWGLKKKFHKFFFKFNKNKKMCKKIHKILEKSVLKKFRKKGNLKKNIRCRITCRIRKFSRKK